MSKLSRKPRWGEGKLLESAIDSVRMGLRMFVNLYAKGSVSVITIEFGA